ncbi:MAG: DoxX family protein [Schleiferiaceae bacterium]|nr:DoxX family protein [Schleiferiaceae bacterium]
MKDISLLILRFVFGGLMILNHGIPKLDKLSQNPIKFPDPLGVGAEYSLYLTLFGELICPVLIVIGLFTRWVSIPAAITMAVAAFNVHLSDPLSVKEASLLFLTAFTIILLQGAGKYSLDNLIRPKAKF